MKFNIHSMALAMPRVVFNLKGSAEKTCSALVPGPCATARAWNSPHPNRLAFRGILTLVDSPSDRPPAGARGHRVTLTRAAAERALPSLLGMGLDFTASFDGHDTRRKVGIITAAEIIPLMRGERKHALSQGQSFSSAENAAGRKGALAPETLKGHGFSRAVTLHKTAPALAAERKAAIEVEGFIFARDFPDVVRELRLHQPSLGMSYEIAGARVADPSEKIWRLTEAIFTGAAVLLKDKAAYSQTSIELLDPSKEKPMNEELTQQFLSTASRLAAAAESLEQALTRIDSGNDAVSTKIDRIIAHIDAETDAASPRITQLEARIAELERANTDLKAQAARSARKTLPPLVTSLLAKHGLSGDASERIDSAVLDKTLAPLSVEQRIAVKAQMARAGIID